MKTATLQPERVFRALSDKTRLRILHLLLAGELCVCDLVAVIGCPQPTASRHLAYLRKAGLVAVRKEGIWCHYRLVLETDEFAASLRQCLEACGELPRLARDRERLHTKRVSCCQ